MADEHQPVPSNEDKSLERLLEISEQNHKILRELERSMRINYIWTGLKIAVVLIPLLVGFLYLQPFLDKINRIYGAVGGSASSTSALTRILRSLQLSQ